jgi:hypothetical protein
VPKHETKVRFHDKREVVFRSEHDWEVDPQFATGVVIMSVKVDGERITKYWPLVDIKEIVQVVRE